MKTNYKLKHNKQQGIAHFPNFQNSDNFKKVSKSHWTIGPNSDSELADERLANNIANKIKSSLIPTLETKMRYYIDQRLGLITNGDELLTRGNNKFSIAEDIATGNKSFCFNSNGSTVARITAEGVLYVRNVWLNGLNLLDIIQKVIVDISNGSSVFVKHSDLKNGEYVLDVDELTANTANIKQELKINNTSFTSTYNEEEQTEELIISNDNTTFTGSLCVDESAIVEEQLTVNGETTLNDNLTVNGETTLNDNLTITGNTTLTTLTGTGNWSTEGTLTTPTINTDSINPLNNDYVLYTGKALFNNPYFQHLKADLANGALMYHTIGKTSNTDESGLIEYFNDESAGNRYLRLSITGRSGIKAQNTSITSELQHYFQNGIDVSGVVSYFRLSNALYLYTPSIKQQAIALTTGNSCFSQVGKNTDNYNSYQIRYCYNNTESNRFASVGLIGAEAIKYFKDKIEFLLASNFSSDVSITGNLSVSGTTTYHDVINANSATITNDASVGGTSTLNIMTANDGEFEKLTVNDTHGIGDPFAIYSNSISGCGGYIGNQKTNDKCAVFHYDTPNNTFQLGIYGTAPDVLKFSNSTITLNKPTTITNSAETILTLTNTGQRYNKVNINGLNLIADTYEGSLSLQDIIEAVDYGGSNKFSRFKGRLNYFLSNTTNNEIIFGKSDDKGDSVEMNFNYTSADHANNNFTLGFWDYMEPVLKIFKTYSTIQQALVQQLKADLTTGNETSFSFGKANNTAQGGMLNFHYDTTAANVYCHLSVIGYSGLKVFNDYTESISPFKAPSITLNGSDLQTTLNNCAKLNANNTFTGYNTFNSTVDVWNGKIVAPNIEQVWNIKFYNDTDMILDFKKMLHGYNDLGRVIYTTSGTYNNTLSLDINKSHSIIARVYSDGSNTNDYFTTIKHVITLLDGNGKTTLKDLEATNGAFTTSLTLNGNSVLTSASLSNYALLDTNNSYNSFSAGSSHYLVEFLNSQTNAYLRYGRDSNNNGFLNYVYSSTAPMAELGLTKAGTTKSYIDFIDNTGSPYTRMNEKLEIDANTASDQRLLTLKNSAKTTGNLDVRIGNNSQYGFLTFDQTNDEIMLYSHATAGLGIRWNSGSPYMYLRKRLYQYCDTQYCAQHYNSLNLAELLLGRSNTAREHVKLQFNYTNKEATITTGSNACDLLKFNFTSGSEALTSVKKMYFQPTTITNKEGITGTERTIVGYDSALKAAYVGIDTIGHGEQPFIFFNEYDGLQAYGLKVGQLSNGDPNVYNTIPLTVEGEEDLKDGLIKFYASTDTTKFMRIYWDYVDANNQYLKFWLSNQYNEIFSLGTDGVVINRSTTINAQTLYQKAEAYSTYYYFGMDYNTNTRAGVLEYYGGYFGSDADDKRHLHLHIKGYNGLWMTRNTSTIYTETIIRQQSDNRPLKLLYDGTFSNGGQIQMVCGDTSTTHKRARFGYVIDSNGEESAFVKLDDSTTQIDLCNDYTYLTSPLSLQGTISNYNNWILSLKSSSNNGYWSGLRLGAINDRTMDYNASISYYTGYVIINNDSNSYNVSSRIGLWSGQEIRVFRSKIESTTGITNVSDARLKENVKELDNKECKLAIENIKTYSFSFKNDDSKKTHYGVIAQDVMKYSPAIVDSSMYQPTNEEELTRKGNELKKGDEYYTVAYTEMIPMLINYCQQLNQRIIQLEEQLGFSKK